MRAKSRLPKFVRYLTALALIAAVAGGLAGLNRLWKSAGRPLTLDSIAASLLAEGRPLDAAQLYKDPLLQGVSWFRAGRYERAATAFSSIEKTDVALYNLGVALAHLSRFEDAIAAFSLLLTRDPTHADAKHNLGVLRSIDRDRESQDSEQTAPPQDGAIRQTHDSGSESQMRAAEEPIAPEDGQSSDDNKPPDQPDQQENTASLGGSGQGESGRNLRIEHQASEPSPLSSPSAEPARAEAPDLNIDNRAGEFSTTESGLSETITMRKLVDNPAVVLRARLESAARTRSAAAQ